MIEEFAVAEMFAVKTVALNDSVLFCQLDDLTSLKINIVSVA